MPTLTDAMQTAINRAHLDGLTLTISAVDAEGRPNVSFRGSTQAYDDETLAMWIRNPESSSLFAAIRGNPHVTLVYGDMATHRRRVGWLFHGRARIDADAGVRDRVFHNADDQERSRDPEMTGAAVLIALDRITGFPLDATD